MNEQTMNIVKQLKDKLMLTGSADEIRKLIADAGGEIAAEDAEKILAEIRRDNAASGTDIDDDEMDAVAGGWSFPWIDGKATDGKDIGCWFSDYQNKNDAGYATNTCQDCKVTLRDKALHEKECPVCHKTYEYFIPAS